MKSTNIPVMIASIAYHLPETVVTNDDLAKILDTSDEWITTRTGIKERRISSGEENTVTLGVEAAKKALEKAKITPENIDLVIAAVSAPAYAFPATACLIQKEICAINAAAFDVAVACSGALYAMNIARSFIESGIYKNILVVATDTTSKFVDWTDRSTCVLFGDGASAIVMKPSENNESDIIKLDLFSQPENAMILNLPFTGKNCPLVTPNEEKPNHILMNGKEVYKFVVTNIPKAVEECIQKAGLTNEDIDCIIPHQANMKIILSMAEKIGYNGKIISNIAKYGNTSAASVMIALCEAIEKKEIKLPATVLLVAFGAGMTYAVAILKLRKDICQIL